MKIPTKFCNCNDKKFPVKVKTVGALIKALEELPKTLPIRQGFGKGCILSVANVGMKSMKPFLEIEEID